MKISFVLMIIAALSACKRAPKPNENVLPIQEVVAGEPLIDFSSPEAGFSCRAPSFWGVPESNFKKSDGVLFVGPRDSVKMTSPRITIHRFPESEPQYNDAQKYAETFWMLDDRKGQPALERKTFGDISAITFHQERPNYQVHGSPKIQYMIRYDYALFPVKGGFFEIVHQAPTDSYAKTLPVFEAVVRSFRPKL